ncbi:MAG: hypothetical protein HDR24_00355 [Lachnospiraceae bacterium]|nr:hypothetical protein [Lachnospiraceae bacterium]
MDWLKAILEKAAVTDGKLDVEAVMKQITAEFPKHAVPKKEFNDKVKELETANSTIAELKKESEGNEELQKKIGEYETEIGNLKKSAEDTAKKHVLKEKLTKSGVLDPDYLIYKHGGIEKFNFDKENNPLGVDDVLKSYKEDKSMSHLFKTGSAYTPAGGADLPAVNPFAKDTFNMTEQGKLLKNNPEQARALAAAAGVKI